jgi:hypothetical protein
MADDLNFGLVSLGTVFCVVTYFFLQIIDSTLNVVYGSDRTKHAFILIRFIFMMMPFYLNNYLLQHLPIVVKRLKKQKSSMKNVAMTPRKQKQKTLAELPEPEIMQMAAMNTTQGSKAKAETVLQDNRINRMSKQREKKRFSGFAGLKAKNDIEAEYRPMPTVIANSDNFSFQRLISSTAQSPASFRQSTPVPDTARRQNSTLD